MSAQGRAGPTVALVPLRSPGVGKSRLAGTLSIEQRAALAGAMLADVAAALAHAPVERVVVAAGGPPAAAAASALGLEVVVDPPEAHGLDAALRAAAVRLGPVATLLVVAADLPRLTAAEVGALLDGDEAVTVAPTRDGGTGGLVRRPPGVIPTAYGRASARRHLEAARRAGVPAAIRHLAGFAHDVDVAADLAALRATAGGRTAAVLRQLEVADAG